MGDAGVETVDLLPTRLTSEGSLLKSEFARPLAEYLVAGSLLATDHASYRAAINVSEAEYNDLKAMSDLNLDELLRVQGDIKAHTAAYKNETFPKLGTLASRIRAYADKVGGKPSWSYYATLVDQIKLLNLPATRADPAKSKEVQDNIAALCDEAIDDAQELAQASENAAEALSEFEKQCRTDEQNLSYRNNDIQTALEGEGGKIAALQKEIQAARDRWWDRYRKFVIATTAAATSVLWLIIPVYGLVLMPVAAGVGSDEARKLHEEMDECDRIITKDSDAVAKYMKLSFDIGSVKTRTKALYDLIGPAIAVIEQNKKTWDAIKDDITNIKEAIAKDKNHIPLALMADKHVEYLIAEWNKVATLADDFRLHAFTTGNVQREDDTALKQRLESIVKSHDM